MRHITHIFIEHVVVSSERSYEAVKTSLEARMGLLGNTDEFVRQVAAHASWEQVARVIEKRLGVTGFSIFSKAQQARRKISPLFSKKSRQEGLCSPAEVDLETDKGA